MLAFVVNQFPRQVDAYFLRELRGLHDSGLDFTIYSLLPPPRGWKVHEDARVLLDRTVYPPAIGERTLRVLRQVARRPLSTLAVTGRIVAGHRAMPAALAKSI